MTDLERENNPEKIIPAGVFSIELTSHEIFLEPQKTQVGTEPGEVPNFNEQTGQYRYELAGGGHGWYFEDEAPENATKEMLPTTVPVFEMRRGAIGQIIIHEKDANGNKIPRGTPGYTPIKPFGLDKLREILAANTDLIPLYEAKVVPDVEFATAFASADGVVPPVE